MSTSKPRIYFAMIPLLLALFVGTVFFWPLLFGRQVIYSGDTARAYLPQRTALLSALRENRLPWWEPGLGVGYPLLAEGETAALYPLNWLLLLVFPADISLNVSLVIHIALAGLGTCLWLRQLRLSIAAAFLGGTVYSMSGVFAAHYSHISIVTVAAWLPWLLAATGWLLHSTTWRAIVWRVIVLSLCVALQFTGGHAQISLLVLLAAGFYAIFTLFTGTDESNPVSLAGYTPFRRVATWTLAVLIGIMLASPQLAAGWELSQLSDRAGGLDSTYFTSFSYHPLLAATYLVPFLQGNPYPDGSVELMAYIGLLPLTLAGAGMMLSRRKEKWFLLGFGVLGYMLAWGRWNPAYLLLMRIPVLNLFRVPARFLLWTSISLACLAALGLESLLAYPERKASRIAPVLLVTVLAIVGSVMVWFLGAQDADGMVRIWRWLPLAWATVVVLLGWSFTQTSRRVWLGLATILVFSDLYAYHAVLNATFNTTESLRSVRQAPVVSEWLEQDSDLFRVYTKEDVLPIGFVQKESLYPNYGLTYGQDSVNLYMPLFPAAYRLYLDGLDAGRLNMLNVRYYLIPQLLPVDEASELYDVANPYANLPYNQWLEIAPLTINSFQVESYLSHSAELPYGALAASIILRDAEGTIKTLPLRAGYETAEWAYQRPDVANVIAYPMAPVAGTFAARSGYPPVDHIGHTYVASWTFTETVTISAVYIEPALAEAFMRVERIRLCTLEGEPVLLNHLANLGDHSIVYRSEDVLVYRNNDVWPRAFTVSAGDALRSGSDVTLVHNPSSLEEAEISGYTAQRVAVTVDLPQAGYLVLADLYYPGWSALVDGQPAQILRVDEVFRAVALEPGKHDVEFTYQFRLLDALKRR